MTCKTCGWAYADASTQNNVDPNLMEVVRNLAEANQEIGRFKALLEKVEGIGKVGKEGDAH